MWACRAFCRLSRSGVRDAAEMKSSSGRRFAAASPTSDVTEEDVVVDRLIYSRERATKDRRYSEIQEAQTVPRAGPQPCRLCPS